MAAAILRTSAVGRISLGLFLLGRLLGKGLPFAVNVSRS